MRGCTGAGHNRRTYQPVYDLSGGLASTAHADDRISLASSSPLFHTPGSTSTKPARSPITTERRCLCTCSGRPRCQTGCQSSSLSPSTKRLALVSDQLFYLLPHSHWKKTLFPRRLALIAEIMAAHRAAGLVEPDATDEEIQAADEFGAALEKRLKEVPEGVLDVVGVPKMFMYEPCESTSRPTLANLKPADSLNLSPPATQPASVTSSPPRLPPRFPIQTSTSSPTSTTSSSSATTASSPPGRQPSSSLVRLWPLGKSRGRTKRSSRLGHKCQGLHGTRGCARSEEEEG